MYQQVPAVYEFSGFQLDIAQKALTRNGEMILLPRKALDLLLYLVQNRGRILEKNELMEALWPDSFVEENNLSHHIFVLRKALGDDQNGNSFIQTIPRRGYKFVAAVKKLDCLPAEVTTGVKTARFAACGRLSQRTDGCSSGARRKLRTCWLVSRDSPY